MISTLTSAGASDITLLSVQVAIQLLSLMQTSKLFRISRKYLIFRGLSDHCLQPEVTIAAVALGAPVIEKHFKLSAQQNSIDAVFSLDPHSFRSLVTSSRLAWEAWGGVTYGGASSDKKFRSDRRSLFTVDLKRFVYSARSY